MLNPNSDHRRSKPSLTIAVVILLLLCVLSQALAEDNFDDHLEAYYKAKYGYQETANGQYQPTLLNYVCFSHYISRDVSVLDGDNYVLHGGVTEQRITDYIHYLSRFGYKVAFDAAQNSTRYVELRDADAPQYMPQVFRFYYDQEHKAIMTIDSQQSEQAFEQYRVLHWENFEDEKYDIKTLAPRFSVALEDVRSVDEYFWANLEKPFCDDAFPSLIESWLGLKRPEKTLEDGSKILVMNRDYADANGNSIYYWLLRVDITVADQAFDLDDWEFCIADEGLCIFYPLQIGNQLIEQKDGLLLRMDSVDPSTKTYTIWLSFPAINENPDLPSRLYISPVRDAVPLMERVSIGFTSPGRS